MTRRMLPTFMDLTAASIPDMTCNYSNNQILCIPPGVLFNNIYCCYLRSMNMYPGLAYLCLILVINGHDTLSSQHVSDMPKYKSNFCNLFPSSRTRWGRVGDILDGDNATFKSWFRVQKIVALNIL